MFLWSGDVLGKGSSECHQTDYCQQEVKFSHKVAVSYFFQFNTDLFPKQKRDCNRKEKGLTGHIPNSKRLNLNLSFP
jgi:hypothetical protein